MNYHAKYKNRLDVSGASFEGNYTRHTKELVSKKFKDSPSYIVVQLNGLNVDARVTNRKKRAEKEISFLPDTNFNIGSIVIYKNEEYLIVDKFDSEIFPKANLKLCNTSLSLPGEPTIISTDELDWRNQPIMREYPGEPIIIPCIVESKIYYNQSTEAINLPDGQISISIPYTEHKEIRMNGEIEVYGERYGIVEVDRTQCLDKTGILIISAKRI